MLEKTSNIFFIVSGLIIVLGITLVLQRNSTINEKKEVAPKKEIYEVELSKSEVVLEELLSDTTLNYYRNKNLESEIVIIHTLRALSCHNCPHDNKFIVEYLDKKEKSFNQMIWFLDQINSFSINAASQHSLDRNYLIGFHDKYRPIFLVNNRLWDRSILIFKDGKIKKRILLPYNLEFKSDSLLTVINNKIEEV
ncbi:hypothetical protein [Gracilimonas sp.]|uniref:hypothetical protein n=1 Tax=Gracilimonas sp. TaxID=1974203 RepID=UPI002870CEA4|nr:hypothetical protein [Gracilimonas sp.]